ncbi:MAG: hypothetical protein NTZ74_10910 [Chloroflexi bacterium]|nr:hypothetical protein [Chloroflexota bacterium]
MTTCYKPPLSFFLVLILFFLSGCSKPGLAPLLATPTEVPSSCSIGPSPTPPPESPSPVALYGLWTRDKEAQHDLLAMTEKSVYWVEFNGSKDQKEIRETFFVIQSVDWASGVITLKTSWVRINGEDGSLDSPDKTMKVVLDGESLYFSITDPGLEAPAPALNGPWKKE